MFKLLKFEFDTSVKNLFNESWSEFNFFQLHLSKDILLFFFFLKCDCINSYSLRSVSSLIFFAQLLDAESLCANRTIATLDNFPFNLNFFKFNSEYISSTSFSDLV